MKDRLKSGISRVDDAKASSSFVEQPASAAGGVLLGERVGVRGAGRSEVMGGNPSEFGFRNSSFNDAKPMDFHIENSPWTKSYCYPKRCKRVD